MRLVTLLGRVQTISVKRNAQIEGEFRQIRKLMTAGASGSEVKQRISGLVKMLREDATHMRLKIEYAREDMYFNTIKAFTSAIDAKDVYTQNHSRRVAEFSVAFARELQLTEQEIMNIGYGATMHDIGKIGVPELILNYCQR